MNSARGRYHPDSVVFQGDGEPRIAAAQIQRIVDSVSEPGDLEDDFSLGGAVGLLEETMAERLGKDRAIFMPTGTLANHLAIRRHCGVGGRAVVQECSHLFNDTGDSVQRLSGINLVPLAQGRVCFTAEELSKALRVSVTGRVMNRVSAVMVETPVRRLWGQVAPWDQLVEISDFCKAESIPSHLDGARLFMMAAAQGRQVSDYAGLFDSVYVSLYKYLGAPFGAILAGDDEFIEGMHHARRMFGGGLAQAWFPASVALKALPEFEERFASAMSKAISLFEQLNEIPGISVKPFEHGSNILPLELDSGASIANLSSFLAKHGVFIYPEPESNVAYLHVNVTVLRRPNSALHQAFVQALAKARDLH